MNMQLTPLRSQIIYRLSNVLTLIVMVVAITRPADAAVISTGDVKPPFALLDTIGSTKTFTVPNPSSTNGGVYVGDIGTGSLDLDNGWTLNSTFGVVANTLTSSTPSASSLTLSEASTWNMTGDFDVGNGATAVVNVSDDSSILVGGQTRLGTTNTGSGLVSLVGSTLSSGSLIVGVAGGGQFTAGGSTLDAGWIDVGAQSLGQGTITLNASIVNCGAGLSTGLQGNGTLNVNNGTTLTTAFANFGIDYNTLNGPSSVATSMGTGTVSGTGTTWNNGSGLVIGYNTRGSLSIENGASVSSGWVEVSRWASDGILDVDNATVTVAQNSTFMGTPSFIVGTEAGSTGAANFSGAGAALTVTDGGFLQVARYSNDAVLNVSAGAQVTTEGGGVLIATEAGSIGVVNLDGTNTSWTSSGQIEVGRSGKGIININGGAGLSTSTVRMALETSSIDSSVNLAGYHSQLNTTGLVSVGEKGTGRMVVADGAHVDIGSFLWLATEPNSSGMVEVLGSAPDPMSPGNVVPSKITTADTIIVGGYGDGSVVVHQGAQLVANHLTSPTNSSAIIGWWPDAHGSLTIDGANSSWTGDGTVNVGFRGIGTLTIQQGGQVQTVDSVIARLPGSTGSVTLAGNNSAWTVQNSLYVGGRPASLAAGEEGTAGPGGTASLTLGAGSHVSVGTSLKLFAGGTIDVSAGGSVVVGSGSLGQPGMIDVRTDGGFTGSGTIVGNFVSAGAVSPGSSPGILSIDGNYTQTLAGTLFIEIGGTTRGVQYDALELSGAAMVSGTLNVSLIGGFIPLVGNKFEIVSTDLGVSGTFTNKALPTLPNGLSWGIRYTADAVVLAINPPGDFDSDGDVDGADFVAWQTNFPTATGATLAQGDADSDGDVDGADFVVWQTNFPFTLGPEAASVPEPAAFILALAAVATIGCCRRRGS